MWGGTLGGGMHATPVWDPMHVAGIELYALRPTKKENEFLKILF